METDRDLVRLETIVREFREAVVACDRHARILLYNSAAQHLFHGYEALGLGQSLFRVCTRAPIEHALRMLQHHAGTEVTAPGVVDASFACATVDNRMLLTCHLSRVRAGNDPEDVFVFTFEDMGRPGIEAGQQGYLLARMIKELRSPLTNLGAAVESLKAYPEMTPAMRASFEDIIAGESRILTERFSALARESEKIAGLHWPLFDVPSADLLACVARRLSGEDGIKLVMTGTPLWLHGDSFSLMLLLHRLVLLIRDLRGVREIDAEALLGDRRVFLDLIWQGEPIPEAALEEIRAATFPDSPGLTVTDVLVRHDSEIWSQKHRRDGYALLRIPVPDAPGQWQAAPPPLPGRQEFYDFSIAEGGADLGDLAAHPLAGLTYVVFDTETTGLRPAEGDEVLAINAVRIVNGRILSGERFERLIRPKRPLPERILPFLTVSAEMLQDEDPAEVVLPKFKDFVQDAVLVAHNGTFDLHFFRSMEAVAGVGFANPMLDTLLLAAVVDQERTDYTLAGIARSLGLEVTASRSVMEDCFLAAQIFLRLLDRLAAMEILTLGDAVAASEKVAATKRQTGG